MQMRRLGVNGPKVTPVGVGTWVMGGPWEMGWGSQDDEQSIQTLRGAWDSGVNWVDTAPIYGLGHAEDVTRRALLGYPDVLVFTKCAMGWGADRLMSGIDLSPDAIRRECEASLRRLGRDHIDLYQLHFPDPNIAIEETWGAMSELVEQGKVRWIGISNHDLTDLKRAHASRAVDAVQIRMHLLDQRNRADTLPWCVQEGVGALIYSPLASGLLTGPLDLDSLPPEDWRHRDERFLQERDTAPQVLAALQETFPEESPEAVSLAWLIVEEGVTAAIVGARVPEELGAAKRAAALTISGPQRAALAASAGPAAYADRPLWR